MPIPKDREIAMMRQPDSWPQWPYLPLKKPEEWTSGCLINLAFGGDHTDPTVYIGNMWTGIDPDKCEKIEYASFEALYDAGWRVD